MGGKWYSEREGGRLVGSGGSGGGEGGTVRERVVQWQEGEAVGGEWYSEREGGSVVKSGGSGGRVVQ